MNQPLKKYCTCTAKADSSDEFVGIRYENGSIRIHFPLGYFPNDDAFKDIHDDELRGHISTLFAVLADDSLISENQAESLSIFLQNETEVRFPMRAYLNVLRNYLDFGYYVERETEYERNAHGKIHWGRTIKTTRPFVTEDKQDVVYLNPIARHVDYNENQLITLVHKYCVYDAIKKLGFIFGIDVQEEPSLDFDYELFNSVLQSKISKTFNDRNLNLFLDLQRIVEYLGDKHSKDNANADDFYFGVNTFAPVWEAMLDRIFGHLNAGESKGQFYPHCHWVVDGKKNDADIFSKYAMRPDTIMRHVQDGVNEIFVLDAKYYTHGVVKGGTLPTSDSINKQLAYAEYIEKHMDVNGQHIYNAFLLPYFAEGCSKAPFAMKYFGFAYGDWKTALPTDNDFRPYHKIIGIYLDVKQVMQNYESSSSAQQKLAEVIRG